MDDSTARKDRRARWPMRDVSWAFRGAVFSDRHEFGQKVLEWQGREPAHSWLPHEVVLRSPRVRIEYFGIIDPTEDEYADLSLDLHADNGEYFTGEELLFKLHNAVVAQLREADHQYFEGLEPQAPSVSDNVPVYRMQQGS